MKYDKDIEFLLRTVSWWTKMYDSNYCDSFFLLVRFKHNNKAPASCTTVRDGELSCYDCAGMPGWWEYIATCSHFEGNITGFLLWYDTHTVFIVILALCKSSLYASLCAHPHVVIIFLCCWKCHGPENTGDTIPAMIWILCQAVCSLSSNPEFCPVELPVSTTS